MDVDGTATISLLEFVEGVRSHPKINNLLLPSCDATRVMDDERIFDEVSCAFDDISGGRQRFDLERFIAYFKDKSRQSPDKEAKLRAMYNQLDVNAEGSISKLHLIDVLRQNLEVATFMLPGIDCHSMLKRSDEDAFDAVSSLFSAIARGKKRIDYGDFAAYFHKVGSDPINLGEKVDRSTKRVLIIGPGFGGQMNPKQGQMIEASGYQVRWCHEVPNPETPNFPMVQHLPVLKAAIDDFRPDCIISASKGGAYTTALWTTTMWTGPTVMINAHPTCLMLPRNQRVVVAQGGNDEVYQWDRAYIENLMATGSANLCFLYFTPNSGLLASGVRSRVGDKHNMQSLLSYDTLPRLIDACLSNESPEMHMIRSWRDRLTPERLENEAWLGYTPRQLRRFWMSAGRRGADSQKLFIVPRDTEEFKRVVAVFKAPPSETPTYCPGNPEEWQRRRVRNVQRVENGKQDDSNFTPYYESLKSSIESQGLDFEPGVHTRWVFHGSPAIDAIVKNPSAGFQPLASGSSGATLWGHGTYFARDAKYVAEGGFAKPGPDGYPRMVMCLLATGIPCVGDPDHHGILPIRQEDYRYNSAVDDLSSPEIFNITHPGAAYAAYVITFE